MKESNNLFNKFDDIYKSKLQYTILTIITLLVLSILIPIVFNTSFVKEQILLNIPDYSVKSQNDFTRFKIIPWLAYWLLIFIVIIKSYKSKLYGISHIEWIILVTFVYCYTVVSNINIAGFYIEFSSFFAIKWPIFLIPLLFVKLINFIRYKNIKFNTSFLVIDNPNDLGKNLSLLDKRAKVASKLSEIIVRFRGETSLAISIQGKFGVGKSTFIGIIKNDIKNRKGTKDAKLIIPEIIEINFWAFENSNEIIKYIIINISNIIDDNHSKNIFKEYLNLLTHDLKYDSIKKLISPNQLENEPDIIKIKENISRRIRRSNKNILVIFEDIDRGGDKNAIQVFRIIRTIVDFPGIIFIAAFDIDNIKNIWSHKDFDINKYLRKIFQIQVNVPGSDASWNEEEFRNRFKTQFEILKHDFKIQVEDENEIDVLLGFAIEIISDISDFNKFINELFTRLIFLESEISLTNAFCLELIRLSNPKYFELMANDFTFILINKTLNLPNEDAPSISLNNSEKKILDYILNNFTSNDFIFNYSGYKKYFDYYLPNNILNEKEFNELLTEYIKNNENNTNSLNIINKLSRFYENDYQRFESNITKMSADSDKSIFDKTTYLMIKILANSNKRTHIHSIITNPKHRLNNSINGLLGFYIDSFGLKELTENGHFNDFFSSYLLINYLDNKSETIDFESLKSSTKLLSKYTFERLNSELPGEISELTLSALFLIGRVFKDQFPSVDALRYEYYKDNWETIKTSINNVNERVIELYKNDPERVNLISNVLHMIYYQLNDFPEFSDDIDFKSKDLLYKNIGWKFLLFDHEINKRLPEFGKFFKPFNNIQEGFDLNEFKYTLEFKQNLPLPFEILISSETGTYEKLCKISRDNSVPNTERCIYEIYENDSSIKEYFATQNNKIVIELSLNQITINSLPNNYNTIKSDRKFSILMNNSSDDSVIKIKLYREPQYKLIY